MQLRSAIALAALALLSTSCGQESNTSAETTVSHPAKPERVSTAQFIAKVEPRATRIQYDLEALNYLGGMVTSGTHSHSEAAEIYGHLVEIFNHRLGPDTRALEQALVHIGETSASAEPARRSFEDATAGLHSLIRASEPMARPVPPSNDQINDYLGTLSDVTREWNISSRRLWGDAGAGDPPAVSTTCYAGSAKNCLNKTMRSPHRFDAI